MASLSVIVFSVLLLVTLSNCASLQVGTAVNGQLAFVEAVKLSAIPLKTRTKNVFYTGDKVIKGIMAVDRANSTAKATITAGGAGGAGAIFANIRLKSERGRGLDYQIQVFV